MSSHAVIYTDGSARPNPGNIGWGVHGYIYQNITDKPIVTLKHTITDRGYLYPEKFTDATTFVEPIEYLDVVGSLDTSCGTNNQAEILAVKTALTVLLEKEIETIFILSDSEYTINNLKDYLFNNKKSQYGANLELWHDLYKIVDQHKEKGIKISFNWIKGHSDNVGNNFADYLSVIGTNNSIDEKEVMDIRYTPGKKYWNIKVEDNPMLSFNRCYFNTQSRFNVIGQYFIADPGPNDLLLGKRSAETGLAVVKLKEPDDILENIKLKHFEVASDLNNIAMINMAKLYTPATYKYLDIYGKYSLIKNRRFNSLDFIDGKPLTTEINPVGLSLKAIEAFNTLEDLLELYKANKLDSSHVIDITDKFFTTEEVKNKQVTSLNKDLTVGAANLDLVISYQNKDTKVPIVLGVDLPTRNKLKKLEETNPKIKLILWAISENSFRYCCVIDCDLGQGVWSNYFADRIFHF